MAQSHDNMIRVSKRGSDYHASLINNLKIWGCGSSITDAIGQLIFSHQKEFGVSIAVDPVVYSYVSKTKTERAERVRLALEVGYTQTGKWWLNPGANRMNTLDLIINPDDYPPTDFGEKALPSRDELRERIIKNQSKRGKAALKEISSS